MSVSSGPRAQRVAGLEVAPGRSARVSLGLPDDDRRAVSAWMAVGPAAGPRVSVVAAEHGFEAAAVMAARALVGQLELASLRGSVLVVPVLRPGDRLERAGKVLAPLGLPGSAGGNRRERRAFSLFSDVVVAAQYVIVLGAPRPGRRAILTAEVPGDESRVGKLARATGAVVVPVSPAAGSILAASAERPSLRLAVGSGDLGEDAATLLAAVRRLLAALGVHPGPPEIEGAPDSPAVSGREEVRAPSHGLLEDAVSAGGFVAEGTALARVGGPFPGSATVLASPTQGIVLEAPAGPAVRRGMVLFVLGRTSSAVLRGVSRAALTPFGVGPRAPLRTGWLERVSLPDLGLSAVPAKIDTGARTSALHVIARRTVGGTRSGGRRPVLELVLPTGGSSRRRLTVRARIKEYVEVRDTSGRTERRPVIETTLVLGPLRRRIRLTLTDRGDMRCPMLVGRSALGGVAVVDPAARGLLGGQARPKRREQS